MVFLFVSYSVAMVIGFGENALETGPFLGGNFQTIVVLTVSAKDISRLYNKDLVICPVYIVRVLSLWERYVGWVTSIVFAGKRLAVASPV